MSEVTLYERIDADLADARRRGDEAGVTTLGLLKSEVFKVTKEPGFHGAIDDNLVIATARKELKKHEESAEAYEGAGRAEAAQRERAAADLVRGYLPTQLSAAALEAELRTIIAEVQPEGPAGFGLVMKAANAKLAGRAQGGEISAAVKRLLA